MIAEADWLSYLREWEGYELGEYTAPENPKPDAVLLAEYTYENYSGDAWYVYIKEGLVYEGYGSHCSYYGLEGQFSPELLGSIDDALQIMYKYKSGILYGIKKRNIDIVIKRLEEMK